MWPHTPESSPRIPNTKMLSARPKASTYYPVSYYSTGPTTDSTRVSNYPTTGLSTSSPSAPPTTDFWKYLISLCL